MIKRIALRLRALLDYWSFVVRHEWPLMLTVVGLILGVEMFLPDQAAFVLSLIALSIGLAVFASEYRTFRARWSEYEFRPGAPLVDIATLPLPSIYAEPVRHVLDGRATALTDNAIDRHVRTTTIAAYVESDAYELPEFLRATAPQVLGKTSRGSVIFNGPVLGLEDDPLPSADAQSRPLRLHRAKFFDAQCSNELCKLQISHRKTGEVVDMRQQLLLDSVGRLAPLAQTELANVVGISTLATTTDGFLVLIEQTAKNSASASLLAPSGSGSLEPVDAENPHESLQQLIINGMNRELAEECGISQEEIEETTVVGYARWLERGAKPEFFGITRLSITASEVEARRVADAEKLYSGGTLCVRVDLTALAEQMHVKDDIAHASACPDFILDRGSLPLLLALRAAALALPLIRTPAPPPAPTPPPAQFP